MPQNDFAQANATARNSGKSWGMCSKHGNTGTHHDYYDHTSLFWRDANPMLMPSISHLFWGRVTRSSRKLKSYTEKNALKLRRLPSRHGTFWNANLARHFQKPYLGKASDGR